MPEGNSKVEISLCDNSLLGYGKTTKFPPCSIMILLTRVTYNTLLILKADMPTNLRILQM
jgi:hypothetical protein